jgi:hypothetical protein
MRSRKTVFILSFIILILTCQSAAAGEFYLHDNKEYWWYHVDNPGFYAVVPSAADVYVSKKVFGYDFLEISWDNGSVVMEVGVIPNSSRDDVINFVAKRWSPFLQDERVFANREITTSNGLPTYFYAVEGSGPDGNKSMLRSVYFSKDGNVVYLAMYLPNNKYQGKVERHWIRAVNDFEWD